MASQGVYPYSLTGEDRMILENLRVPVPSNETKRIETLRRSKILDEEMRGAPFDRFTSLAVRLFNMPYAALTFVEVDQVFFKSKVGFDIANIHRNDWFDAYAILPEASEVFVVPDCQQDRRFKDKKFVRGAPNIRFFAGAAVILDDVRLGVLSVMDTVPHPSFTLEDKENLLDLGAAVAQVVGEKLQTALNLSAERANIVVSMMHHLRTPMTSLNFATSLLCNDVQQMTQPTPKRGVEENKSNQDAQSTLQSFESSFNEIHASLNQLNVLVDSSLSLGKAIIKCSNNELLKNSLIDQRSSKFSECNIIDYLTDIFNHSLPAHKHGLEVEWIIDTSLLSKGSHVTFPDAIMLVVISTFSHMATESDALGYLFSFSLVEEDQVEYPELMHKMLEGHLGIKVFRKDEKPLSLGSMSSNGGMGAGEGMEVPSKQNFLSIDKIIRAINGSARETVEDISLFSTVPQGGGSNVLRSVQEFFIPCKILLASTIPASRSSAGGGGLGGGMQNKIRLYRAGRGGEKEKEKLAEALTVSLTTPIQPPSSDPTSIPSKDQTPRLAEHTNPLAAAPVASVPTAPEQLQVLIIEDTIPVQKLLARWLHNHGCSVKCANNGKVGLDLLVTEGFDIVFVDFLMPVMLGITTMKLFQEFMATPSPDALATALQARNKVLLIVGMSATALESEQEEAFSYGMHFFCPKPVSLDLLGIILEAKRSCASNEQAIEQICDVTHTSAEQQEADQETTDREPGGGAAESHPELSIGGTEQQGGKAKWNIFRSHRQIGGRKVAPETGEK